MIPRKIHYCWFGRGEKPQDVLDCMASWRKFCPDYEIIEWNEDNYDVNKIPFTKQAYEQKAWAFVSDYARLDIIYQYGGIYMDTDVELIKGLESFLPYEMYAGFESTKFVAFGLGFGSEAAHPYLKEQMELYERMNYINRDGTLNRVNCPLIQTKVLVKNGMKANGTTQTLAHAKIFACEYFSPKSFQTGEIQCTANTVSIHHFKMSWVSDKERYYKETEWRLKRKFGNKFGKLLSMAYSGPFKIKQQYETKGAKGVCNYLKLIMRISKK